MTSKQKALPRIIAFTGPKESGKDTIASVLFGQNQAHKAGLYVPLFMKQPFAFGVKSICKATFGWSMDQQDDKAFKETCLEDWPRIEPRWAMMDIANFMRDKYGADVWVHALEKRIALAEKEDPHGAYVITDLRFPNEVEWLKKQDALIMYVQRDEAEERLKEAQESGDPKALNPSEMYYDLMKESADYIIDNNREIYKAQNDAMNHIRHEFEHWTYWGMGKYAKEQLA